MTSDQNVQLEHLFYTALELKPSEREAFLQQACGLDEQLRCALEQLLHNHEQADAFLSAPVWKAAPALVIQQAQFIQGRRLSHYLIDSLLGRGGMGEVYLAEDTRLGRNVALKLLPADYLRDIERVLRFEREAKAASSLNHPNILTIYEFDQEVTEDAVTHYIVSEYVTGRTLREKLDEATISVDEALDIALQMASALSAAHAAGIVHRDFKPENVMVRPDGLVKVLDFGLAKLLARDEGGGKRDKEAESLLHALPDPHPSSLIPPPSTNPGAVMGTVSYMSPEQRSGQEVDTRTDVFSFGLVLYEILFGKQPLTGVIPNGVVAEILKTKPPPLAANILPELARLVERALSKEREARHQNGAELLAELKAIKRQLDSGTLLVRQVRQTTPLAGSFKWSWPAVSLILVPLMLAALVWSFFGARAPALTEKDTVLLADFENRTGVAVFEGTLKQALAVQLAQTPFLNLLPEARISETLMFMQRKPDERLTRELAREICIRQGLRVWLAGSIAQFGRRYAITLEAVDAQSGAALARALREVEGKEQVLNALGEMANAVREQLGESLASRRQFNQPLEQATTSSLSALDAYSLGVSQGQQSRPFDAIQHYLRALEFDPDFAIAHSRLASAYSATNQPQRSIQHATRAFELRTRASQRERLNIEMIYYSNVTRELEKRFEIASLLAQTYPRDPGPHGVLAAFHINRGRSERALSEAREAVRLSEGKVAGYYNPLASALLQLNRFVEAKETILQAQARQLESPAFAQRLYEIGFVQNDTALMQAQLDWALGKAIETQPLSWQAQTAAFAGRLNASQTHSQSAVTIARQRNLPEAAAVLSLEAALRLALLSDERRSKKRVAQASSQAPNGSLRGGRGNALLLMAPLSLALSGDLRQAEYFCDDAARQNRNNLLFEAVGLPVARAAIALKRRQPDQAIALLEAARPHEAAAEFWPNYLRAQAYLDLQHGADAATEFQKIIDHRGWEPTSMLWPLAHLGLARAAALIGNIQKSQQAYQIFFTLWSEADADLPLLRAARLEAGH
jgi:serine/threonine protein kinase